MNKFPESRRLKYEAACKPAETGARAPFAERRNEVKTTEKKQIAKMSVLFAKAFAKKLKRLRADQAPGTSKGSSPILTVFAPLPGTASSSSLALTEAGVAARVLAVVAEPDPSAGNILNAFLSLSADKAAPGAAAASCEPRAPG